MRQDIAFSEDLKLFYNRYSGTLSMEGLSKLVAKVHDALPQIRNYSSIIDFRYAKLKMNFQEIKQMAEFLLSRQEIFIRPRAILVDDTKQTALGMLLREQLEGAIRMEVFSTWEASCRFLKVDPDKAAKLTTGKFNSFTP